MIKKTFFFLIYCVFVMNSTTAYAKQLELVLVAPQEAVQAGQQSIFTLYFNNPTKEEIPLNKYDELFCKIISKEKTERVKAKLIEKDPQGSMAVPDGGFAKKFFSHDPMYFLFGVDPGILIFAIQTGFQHESNGREDIFRIGFSFIR